jgi:hypothetical protein
MDKHGFPTGTFFVAYRRFRGPAFGPNGSWGDILDGPETDEENVIETILEAWRDEQYPPDTDELRVWCITPGKPAEDCTAWAVRTVLETAEFGMGGL